MFGRKILKVDAAARNGGKPVIDAMRRGWVVCDMEPIGRPTKRHEWLRVTMRRKRPFERVEKPSKWAAYTLFLWKDSSGSSANDAGQS